MESSANAPDGAGQAVTVRLNVHDARGAVRLRAAASGRAGPRQHDRAGQPRRAPVRYPRVRRPEGTRVRRPPRGRRRADAVGPPIRRRAAARRPASRARAAWPAPELAALTDEGT